MCLRFLGSEPNGEAEVCVCVRIGRGVDIATVFA